VPISQSKMTTQKGMSERDLAPLDTSENGLWFETVGAGQDVLLIHAGIADSRMREPQWRPLSQKFRLTRVDLRGFGKSPRRVVAGADHIDLVRLLDRRGIERIVVIGSSFGGNVALDFALTFAERASALVLVGTLAGMTAPTPQLRAVWAETDAAQTAGEIERGVELENRAWVDGPLRTADEVDAGVRASIAAMNRRVWERVIAGPPPERSEPPIDRVGRLEEITVPVLLIEGTLDQPDVGASMNRLARGIPHAERIRIPGAAHFPNLERPAEFNPAVLAFLKRVL
jgi:3-oxoadipate enol-lactonase